MKLNAWKIIEIPSKVYKVKTTGKPNFDVEFIKGYVTTKGVAHLIGDKNKIGEAFQFVEGESKELSQEHQLKLLYYIFDKSMSKN